MKNLINELKKDFIIEKQEEVLLEFLQAQTLVISSEILDKIKLFSNYKLDFETTFAYICFNYNLNCNNEKINTIVESIRNIMTLSFSIDENRESEILRKMIIAISKDLRVIIIKLCCALYEISNYTLPITDAEKYALNIVKELYAPLAERFGFNALKSKLEDCCFKLLEPDVYNSLSTSIENLKATNEEQIEITKNHLEKILKELNINAQIFYRQKHLYSINKKLKAQNITLSLVYDLIAMRVIVDTVEDCYAVLGKIHGIYKPIPSRVKDYIAVPKQNGYQSLHTTIVAENKRPLEIQIRTHEMHKFAEYGVAAHWIYKEKRKQSELDKKMTWIREIMESSENLNDKDFADALKTNLISDSIFVQSPKGKIFEFPKGSSIIDFAYAIHSDVGNYCVGAKVNGKIKPIKTTLFNGDVVEILTSPVSKGPSKDWLNLVKTFSAKSKINSFFKKQLKEENIKLGKSLVEQGLKNKNITVSKEDINKSIIDYANKHNYNSIDEVFASIGFGSLSSNHFVNKIANEVIRIEKEKKLFNGENNSLIVQKDKSGVLIDGKSGMLVRYARCCSPLVEDKIVGYISRGRGVTIHRFDCPNLKDFEEERLIDAEWATKEGRKALIKIKIVTILDDSILGKIINIASSNSLYLSKIENKNFKDNKIIFLSLFIEKSEELNKFIEDLYKIKDIKEVVKI